MSCDVSAIFAMRLKKAQYAKRFGFARGDNQIQLFENVGQKVAQLLAITLKKFLTGTAACAKLAVWVTCLSTLA